MRSILSSPSNIVCNQFRFQFIDVEHIFTASLNKQSVMKFNFHLSSSFCLDLVSAFISCQLIELNLHWMPHQMLGGSKKSTNRNCFQTNFSANKFRHLTLNGACIWMVFCQLFTLYSVKLKFIFTISWTSLDTTI